MPTVTPPMERFLAKVDATAVDGCHIWTAARDRDGYPLFQATSTLTRRGGRWLWEVTNGPIPDGYVLCHSCDNPPCVRLDHLFLGTIADNNRDRNNKHRQSSHEAHYAAKLTAEQVEEIRASRGVLTQRETAARFGISRSHVSNIQRGAKWQ